MTDRKFFLAIISTKRPKNVSFMQKICEPFECVWFVNEGEADEYIKAGAHYVNESASNICEARNNALNAAYRRNLPCIQISDDLKNIKTISLDQKGNRATNFITVEQTINALIEQIKINNSYFGGVAINSNPLNYTGKDISIDKLIVNDFICMMPSQWKFDERLPLKEDYDMCVQQLLHGNKIIRLNNILCDFPHRQNEGGANTYRNDTTEAEATRKLMVKWPQYIIPHRTRGGQVSLNYKAIREHLNGNDSLKNFL